MSTQLRADAQRNLERVLDAAGELFADRGCDVSVDEIARRAGVGHATVFRRFPTKDALIAAVVAKEIEGLAAFLRQALERDDADEAFRAFAWRAGEMHARNRALYEGLQRCVADAEVAGAKAELNELVAHLVEHAQEAGALRRDISAEHVTGLLGSAILAAPPDDWRRYLQVVLDGLAARG